MVIGLVGLRPSLQVLSRSPRCHRPRRALDLAPSSILSLISCSRSNSTSREIKSSDVSFWDSLRTWVDLFRITLPLLGPFVVDPREPYRDQRRALRAYDTWAAAINRRLDIDVTYSYHTDLASIEGPVVYVWLNQSSVYDSCVFTNGLSTRDRPYFFICNPGFLAIPFLGMLSLPIAFRIICLMMAPVSRVDLHWAAASASSVSVAQEAIYGSDFQLYR